MSYRLSAKGISSSGDSFQQTYKVVVGIAASFSGTSEKSALLQSTSHVLKSMLSVSLKGKRSVVVGRGRG